MSKAVEEPSTAALNPAVDPAGLLVAVLTVGVGPLTTAGMWEAINTIIAVVVLTIVVAYAWPRNGSDPDSRHWVGLSVALGFTFAVGAAWPIQAVLAGGFRALGEGNPIIDTATRWSAVAGLAAAVFCYLALRISPGRTSRRGTRRTGSRRVS